MQKIIIASDHGGYDLKLELIEHLKEKNFDVVDIGTKDKKSCNYPTYAKKLCAEILNNNFKRGILVCGTGLGMQISANRFKGIRAVCVSDTFSAKMSKAHNNSNVLCLGGRVLGVGLAKEILDTWLSTEFESGRHQQRIDLIDEL